MNNFPYLWFRVLVCIVREPNQADHVIGLIAKYPFRSNQYTKGLEDLSVLFELWYVISNNEAFWQV